MSVKLRKFLINLIPVKSLRKKLRNKNLHYFMFQPQYPKCYISREAHLHNPENIEIGENVFIGKEANLYAEGGLVLQDNVMLGANVTVLTTNHNFKHAQSLPFDNKGFLQKVYFGKSVWVGAGCMILSGVRIDDGAIVAAGSVVTKSVPECAIVGGNPARIIGWRDKEEYKKLEQTKSYFKCDGIEWQRVEGYKKYLEE